MPDLLTTMAVGPLVSMVKDKASSYLLDQYKVMEGMEKQHRILKRRLPAIMDVITDAEEQAAAHREGAKAWLEELKTVAYEANEVFDEFKYEALRREAKKKGHYNKLGFEVIKLFPTHNHIVFHYRMGWKLRQIVQSIEVLVTEMNAFQFRFHPQPPVLIQWRQMDSVIRDPKRIASKSRNQDKNNIVDKLLGQASSTDLLVVPIFGMGGLGKTTLAQLVYNEPRIQKHFPLLLWVCVSDSFDVDSLAKCIVEAAPKKKDGTGDASKKDGTEDASKKKDGTEDASKKKDGTEDASQKKDDTEDACKTKDDSETRRESPIDSLQRVLSGQKYLLVLDDVWNRDANKWEELKACLQHGSMGSAVLTTTRDKEVAKIMGTVKSYNLKALDDTFIKEIIEARAFSLHEKKTELAQMVDEIVKRCAGSPLAATALGSVLSTKTSVEEWKAVSSTSSICTEESGILPILMLSFNDLTSHMKQCFAFCAMFPKDYEIDVEKLIQLWIANGFIPEQKHLRPETIGKQIFDALVSRSFFQDVKRVLAEKSTCKIHDLMHDVALSTMEKECAVLTEKPSQNEWLLNTTRHLFLSCKEPETILNGSLKERSPAIKTLLCDGYIESALHHLSKYSSVQALQFCLRSKSFPLKAKHLHHLRYLDLSRSHIKGLPQDISILYNLQTLNLSGCEYLDCLPKQMIYMTALRHLYTHGCPLLKSMPPHLGELSSLQTLTCFVADTSSDSSDVGELQHLNLGGELELCKLDKVTEADAKLANLRDKGELRVLTLRWKAWRSSEEDQHDSEVLQSLEPHDDLQVLRVYCCQATTFPTWMVMLQNMVEIHLCKCQKLKCLFSCNTSFTFPKLKKLTLAHLAFFERWWEIQGGQGQYIVFPQLEELFIQYCGKITALPEAVLLTESSGGDHTMVRLAFPALKVLGLHELVGFQRWEAVEGTPVGQIMFPELEKLAIDNCPVLTALPAKSFLGRSFDRIGVDGWSAFPKLEELQLNGLQRFSAWGAREGTRGQGPTFPNLRSVHIKDCPELTTPPEAPNLNVLDIHGGNQQMSLWVAQYMTSLTSLKLVLKDTVTTTVTEHRLIQPLGGEEKCNHESPLATMQLFRCYLLLQPVALELWTCFVRLEELVIRSCDALVHWPHKEFESLVSLRRLVIMDCNCLTGKAQALLESSKMEWSPLLPCLESLEIQNCASLEEVFDIPASLRKMAILECPKLRSCSDIMASTDVSEPSTSSGNHFFPSLEFLSLGYCDSLTDLLVIPPTLKELQIVRCNRLKSLVSCSGELPLLERLVLKYCETLESLPSGSQSYKSLRWLTIRWCPCMVLLPKCLQQRLGNLEKNNLDLFYEGMLVLPSRKYSICLNSVVSTMEKPMKAIKQRVDDEVSQKDEGACSRRKNKAME